MNLLFYENIWTSISKISLFEKMFESCAFTSLWSRVINEIIIDSTFLFKDFTTVNYLIERWIEQCVTSVYESKISCKNNDEMYWIFVKFNCNLLIKHLIVRCLSTEEHRDLFVFYDLREKKHWDRARFVCLSFLCRKVNFTKWASSQRICRMLCLNLVLVIWFTRCESDSLTASDQIDKSRLITCFAKHVKQTCSNESEDVND